MRWSTASGADGTARNPVAENLPDSRQSGKQRNEPLTNAAHRPPLVCSTGGFWTLPLERSLDIISQAGFDTIELMLTHDPATQSAEVAGRLASNAGLRIQAVHAPMLVLTRRVWGPGFMPIIERSVPLARSLGAEVLVLHP